jgi:hypothetical protein
MTKLFDKLDIELLNNGVLVTMKSKRIKQYLDYIENKTDYREFTTPMNRLSTLVNSNEVTKFYSQNGINLKWLLDRNLDEEMDFIYEEILVKSDFNRWVNQVQLRLEAINREIEKTYNNAICSMTRNDMMEKATVLSKERMETPEIDVA